MRSIRLTLALVLLLAAGCSSGIASDQTAIKTIDDVQYESILSYSGTYVGNNSDVLALLSHLPGGETVGKLDLTNEKINVTYEVNGDRSEETFHDYWFSDNKNALKTFHYNAIYLSLLVPNAKGYEFHVQEKNRSFTRDEMTTILGDEFPDLPNEDELMDDETVKAFVTKHEDELEMIANNLEDYFNEK
ncbi:DUF4825 domain-containing protein [Guptibacillus hwajinpoensis]|uniref:DUF4825 domain-containing protein n=1 Tax=Guptibacillus hwajinpoensis TaxID=208199 RepID=UPI001CD55613|nr:DUF4825 domain-containing protein [Pseudalkalibacillus hwajinpoensis]MCA0992116.1 DUF4825 domain-containing protein [Pseudalkalibacillus hwajinpoensis]